jgi:DNA polymerase-3 subunit alpha
MLAPIQGDPSLPVHNHTEFSALDGYGKPEEIAKRIEQLGLPGAFITDHGTVAGWGPFAKAMKKRDLYAGFGMEAYQTGLANRGLRPEDKGRDAYHLVLLAKNQRGYTNLLRLSDEANRTGFYYAPRVDWDLLEKYSEGIIATSACMGSLISKGIRQDNSAYFHKLRKIFRDDFYIELHTYETQEQYDINRTLVQMARQFSCPVIVANDAHYPSPEDWVKHEYLLAMQYNKELDEPHHPQCLYIMGEDDVRSHLSYLGGSIVDEAIANTDLLMKQCNVELPKPKTYLPKYPGTEPANDKLARLLWEGLEERYSMPLADEVLQRAIFEYKAICEAGLADYFLIVWDFINEAYKRGIMTGPGRGSVGGSILAYALGITNIDPIKYGLYFERFWNPGRSAGLPDIDVDFESQRIGEMRRYVASVFGEDHVMRIGNHITMGAKSALDKVAKAMWGSQVPYRDLTQIKAIIDTTTDAGKLADWDEIDELVGDDLKPWKEKYPRLFEFAREMTGRLSTYGVHASAVVISSVPLPEHLPAMLRTAKGEAGETGEKVLVTQLEMHGVEDAGFPKFDFLGLRNLDTLMLTALASQHFGTDSTATRQKIIDYYREWDSAYNTLPDSFWEYCDRGKTLGLFQIEQGNSARKIAKRIKPRSVLDLALIVALNRPGPLRNGTVDRFIARRNGDETVVYPHPILQDILEETLGDFVFQEQVIAYMRAIGYSLSEADEIRKILGKKLVDKMAAEEERYMPRASEHMAPANAKAIWDSIVEFSKYSFNKSHAVGYGLVLARTMYAKWKWLVENQMSLIVNNPGNVGDYIQESYSLGIKILGPDINRSESTIAKVGDQILFGLVDIKGVGNDAVKWIVVNRPYASYEEFVDKLEAAQEEWKEADPDVRGRSPRQTVRSNVIKAMLDAGAFDAVHDREVTERERIELEEALLGIALWTDERIDRLVGQHRKRLECLPPLSTLDTDEDLQHRVPGIITKVTKTKTKPDARYQPNRDMGFVTIEWKGESVRMAAFPDAWDDNNWMFQQGVVGEFLVKSGPRGASLVKGIHLGSPE